MDYIILGFFFFEVVYVMVTDTIYPPDKDSFSYRIEKMYPAYSDTDTFPRQISPWGSHSGDFERACWYLLVFFPTFVLVDGIVRFPYNYYMWANFDIPMRWPLLFDFPVRFGWKFLLSDEQRRFFVETWGPGLENLRVRGLFPDVPPTKDIFISSVPPVDNSIVVNETISASTINIVDTTLSLADHFFSYVVSFSVPEIISVVLVQFLFMFFFLSIFLLVRSLTGGKFLGY
jgi:hypothetical protein